MLGFRDYLLEAKDVSKWEPSLQYLESTIGGREWKTLKQAKDEVLLFMKLQNKVLHKCFPNPEAILRALKFRYHKGDRVWFIAQPPRQWELQFPVKKGLKGMVGKMNNE